MALKAGYVGVKRWLYEKLQATTSKNVQDIDDLWSISVKTGAVNHLPNILTSQTKAGVTVTVDDNKVVTLDTAGSAIVSATSFIVYEGKGSDLQWLNGKYLSGCIDGSDTTYIIRVGYNESPWTALAVNKTTPVLISGIPNTTANIAVSIYIYSGTTLNNVKLYPMVADCPDVPYAPYAKTNQQLTATLDDHKTTINGIISAATGAADFAAFKTAMAALTPLTRSAAPDTREVSPEVIADDPEPVTKTTRSTKKTATTKEGE